MDRDEVTASRVQPRSNTVDELAAVLRAHGVEERFVQLSIDEQLSYVDWVERGADEGHRQRRMRMIAAVIAQSPRPSTTET